MPESKLPDVQKEKPLARLQAYMGELEGSDEFKEQFDGLRPPRIIVVPQGAAKFSLENQESESFDCVVVTFRNSRRYWAKPPEKYLTCYSEDAVRPALDANEAQERLCGKCVHGKFVRDANGKHQNPACKQIFQLVVFPLAGFKSALPCILALPPICRREWERYRLQLSTDARLFTRVRTHVTAVADKSPSGFAVTIAKFEFVEPLDDEAVKVVGTLRKMKIDIKPSAEDEYPTPDKEDSGDTIPEE